MHANFSFPLLEERSSYPISPTKQKVEERPVDYDLVEENIADLKEQSVAIHEEEKFKKMTVKDLKKYAIVSKW